MRLEHRGNDRLQILAHFGGLESTQTIVGAKRHHHDGWSMFGEQRGHTPRATGRGLASDTGVDDTIRIAFPSKARTEQTRPSVGERDAIARAQTVTEDQ